MHPCVVQNAVTSNFEQETVAVVLVTEGLKQIKIQKTNTMTNGERQSKRQTKTSITENEE